MQWCVKFTSNYDKITDGSLMICSLETRIAFGKIHLEKLNWFDHDSIENKSLLANYSSIIFKVLKKSRDGGSMHSGEGYGF